MEGKGMENSLVGKSKPYVAMICLQFGYAGMNIVTKVSLNGGMSHYALVTYRNAIATAVIAPFALLLERKVRPTMTFPIFMQILVLGLLGPVIDQNFYYAGMEKVDIKKLRCQAKVVGTLITVAGAMLMTSYKGHVINLFWSGHIRPAHASSIAATTTASDAAVDEGWVQGSVLLFFATLAWAAFFILQSITMRKYPAQLSLMCLVCFLGTLQSGGVTFVMEHRPSVWTIGWDMNLFATVYAGIISSGVAYYAQGLVMEKKGPVFVTAFGPVMMIIVAFMSSFILAEKFYIGGTLGALLIVMGANSVLCGNYKQKEEQELVLESVKSVNSTCNQMATIVEDTELEDIESQKIETIRVLPI
ncbi:hypothetical protein Cgig2_012581 [Carnegiea gigantea]|uniref:WAT1-related protein n=1 Tax=Carnegiea gigantea TaxID=171969 RepID=A0A9Q1K2W1_9CARY|nr:hypothetical protein Cgig2_012581 [Carnegiea gigantea]